jgi:hypothetical protein
MVWRKKGIDVYDYTQLQKRGLLKKAPESSGKIKVDHGFIDLGASKIPQESSSSQEQSSPTPGLFGFLDAAASSSSQPSTSSPPQEFSSPPQPQQTNPLAYFEGYSPSVSPQISELDNLTKLEINSIKTKVDDLEYKIDRFMDKLERIEAMLERLSRD